MKMKLKTRKRKSDGSVGFNPVGHVGSNWHWLVILPLQRVGGCRCSMKPASRISLIFRNQLNPEPQLKSVGSSSLCLERAGHIESLTEIQPTSLDQCPITSMPPLGLQAHISTLQSSAQQHKNLNSNDLIFQFTRSSLQLIFTQHNSTRTI